jgi:hypothetical protein
VNHLEADTVQETPGVALGTFSVEYHSANVLFDTRATHSFVTASWVESHKIPVAPMYPPMRVSSVGGRTQTDRFFPSAKVQIMGIEFPADLIVMGNQDTTIDVILGMNWLTKYQASLSCDKRTVKLVSLSGEEALVELVLSGPTKGSCHQVTAHIEEIHEKNYPTHDLELAAVVHALKTWSTIFMGRSVISTQTIRASNTYSLSQS